MNAKFEKWWESEFREVFMGDGERISIRAWQAAIQSLDVTPELVALADAVFCATRQRLHFSGLFGDIETCMYEALTAVLSALKEQEK